METNCTSTKQWLATVGVGEPGVELEDSAPHAAHFSVCPECKELLAHYGAFSERFQEACAYTPSTKAKKIFISAAQQQRKITPQYDALVGALRETQKSSSSPGAEHAFLQAARAQVQAPAKVIPFPARVFKPAMAVSAAAAAFLIVFWSNQTPTPVESPTEVATATSKPVIEAPIGQEKTASGIILAGQVGEVFVNGKPFDPKTITKVIVGATITTGKDSQVQLRDKSNAAITINAQTNLRVAAWGTEATRLNLQTGSVAAKVVHRAPEELFEIATANARVTVIGTEFSVTYTPQGQTVVKGFSGKVRVERLDGRLAGFVTAGQTLSVDKVVAAAARRDKPQRLAKAEPITSPPPRSAISQARTFLAEGQAAQAVELLLGLKAGDWHRDALLGDAYQLTGQYPSAIDAYAQALKGTAKPPAPLLADLATLQEKHGTDGQGATPAWHRYLALYPNGADAPSAHFTLGKEALRSRKHHGEGEKHLHQLMDVFPRSVLATSALALLGGHLLKEERWAEAETLFMPYAQEEAGTKAETALVGLIRVRIAQGNLSDARRLVVTYVQKFPEGRRKSEVNRLKAALSKL